MSKEEYMEFLRQAVYNFTMTIVDELDGEDVNTINDEFMLELYSATRDKRAP